MLDAVLDYENSYLSERKEQKSKSGGIHTINEFKSKPFEIQHYFNQDDQSNNTIYAVIVIIIILIVLVFILRMLFRK